MELVLYLSVQGLRHEMPGSSPGMTNGGGYVIPSAGWYYAGDDVPVFLLNVFAKRRQNRPDKSRAKRTTQRTGRSG